MATFTYNLPSDNLIAAITPTVIAGTIDPVYGVSRLCNGQPYNPCKFTGTSATLQWDLGSAKTPALPVIIHGNIDGTISWQTNDASNFLGTGNTFAVTATTVDVDGYFDDVWTDLSAATARRYLRLVITGNSKPIVLGELWVGGQLRSMTHDPAKGIERPERHMSLETTTGAGVSMFYDLGVREESTRQMVVTTTRTTGLVAIRDWYRACAGPAKPFPLVDSLTQRCQFSRWDLNGATRADVQPSKRALHELVPATVSPWWVTVTIGFEQVSRGLSWP